MLGGNGLAVAPRNRHSWLLTLSLAPLALLGEGLGNPAVIFSGWQLFICLVKVYQVLAPGQALCEPWEMWRLRHGTRQPAPTPIVELLQILQKVPASVNLDSAPE